MWIARNVRWLMTLSGVLTFSMVYAAIAPEAALSSMFGETLSGPLANLVVRNWGVLIALVGGMLIYGAFNPPVQPLVLIVAAASKAIFISLVFAQASRYAGQQVIGAAVIDLVMVGLFVWYLLAVRAPSRPTAVTVT